MKLLKHSKLFTSFLFFSIATGSLAGLSVITTSCSKKDTGVVISQSTFDDNSKYQVSSDTIIITSEGPGLDSHNVFFDLQKYSNDNGGTAIFTISGTVNFGILVGFNENVSLYGESGSLIDLTDQDTPLYEILVGSTESQNNTYTGNMYIDETVNVHLTGSSTGNGVFFNNIGQSSHVTINGNWFISCSKATNAVWVLGGCSQSSSMTIDGNFSINSISDSSSSSGVLFTTTFSGLLNVNGNFLISTDTEHSYSNGIRIYGTTDSAIVNIGGNFSIHSIPDAFGVVYNENAGGVNIIDGCFSIYSSSGTAYGVKFPRSAPANSTQIVSGIFSIFSNENLVYGVNFGDECYGERRINGYFSLQTLSIDGRAKTYGIYIVDDGIGTNSGTPTFYSNKADSGNWISNGGTESWNGGTDGTTIDGVLELTQVYDTDDGTPADSHFSFLGVSNSQASPVDSKTEFNNILTAKFSLNPDSYIKWSNIVANINDL